MEYDKEIYGNDKSKYSGMEVEPDDEDEETYRSSRGQARVGPSKELRETAMGMGGTDADDAEMLQQYKEQYGSGLVNTRIADRESEYHQRRMKRALSPGRGDAFADDEEGKHNNTSSLSTRRSSAKDELAATTTTTTTTTTNASATQPKGGKTGRRRRWDDGGADAVTTSVTTTEAASTSGSRSHWEETPLEAAAPAVSSRSTAAAKPSRWDDAPTAMTTSSSSSSSSSSSAVDHGTRWEAELAERNRPWRSSAEFEALLPPLSQGYSVLPPPQGYKPLDSRSSLAPPSAPDDGGFVMQQQQGDGGESASGGMAGQDLLEAYGIPPAPMEAGSGNVPALKPEDYEYFGKLVEKKKNGDNDGSGSGDDNEEAKEKEIMLLLLKIKNGTPAQRKVALRQIADRATHFGAEALFNQILPLLMSPMLEDQERHLLVKVIDRVLDRLSDLVRPFVHKILVVIEPLLIDEDYYARMEGREIISNLSKAAGLTTMISTLREDIDNPDEYVRNTTSRAFAVVASALGIPNLLPFLKAVCTNKKSWEARHTGIKIVQQVAILMGASTLPHLKALVSIIKHGLTDDQQKVCTITAQALASLAAAAYPYGVEAFDDVLRPLWQGVKQHRHKALAAFLRAIGFVIPLMEDEHANYYTREIMVVVTREFSNPDEEMKKVVLKVVQQCVVADGVDAAYVKESILPEFFKKFWVRRMALDRRNSRAVVETTVELSNKVGGALVIAMLVDDLKDESEPYRVMVLDTVERIVTNLGVADVDQRLEEQMVDGMLYVFQEQAEGDAHSSKAVLAGFGSLANALGNRMKSYLPQVCGTIKWRLNNKAANIRMQAADLITKISGVMKVCDEEQLMGHLGVLLFENLGEEYPDVLGSILGALTGIVGVIGMPQMTPPIKDLLPRLTPILKNRHEKVQENCIDLVGRIADRGPEYVSAREWIRICFELLDMLKAKKKAIRRAAVNTFGYIAKAIGPQDVLHTLLSNLKVQERQMRVCTTVAIAIVAETCAPFTVLPALMNEYRIPDINIQNGVLKALSFMFEYIGELGKDYVYATAPLLEDALIDRDNVHRQTAATCVKHIALGSAGQGCEDVLGHLLNFVWPNIFEESPHVINATVDAIEGLMVALGPAKVQMYLAQGLFHPARKVREAFWRVYNAMYRWNQDAMVASFPYIPDDSSGSVYRSTQLELLI
jgi:splicing factor 3B subunit 1